ncbi:amidohydrolase [Georgenia thermotolerans]|nr:amidohydrolase [Georgenia thermotolerans]
MSSPAAAARPGTVPPGTPARTAPLLLRRVRLVPVAPRAGHTPAPAAPDAPVDLRIAGGVVTAVAPRLDPRPDEPVLDAAGRWAAPGLWDRHVHLGQWAGTFGRLDLSTADSAAAVLDLVRARLAGHPPGRPLLGFGFRDALWPDAPTLGALDAVAGATPVVLSSGDVHSGWLSSAARALLGLPAGAPGDDGLVREGPWFAALARVPSLPGADAAAGYRQALAEAAARGVVGVVDVEFAANEREWPERIGQGLDLLRVRAGVYPDRLEAVLAAGLRTGDPLPGGAGLATMGPLKIISDGALNTRTAHCRDAYPVPGDAGHPHGVQSVGPDELARLLRRARTGGLTVALHAIGDAAVGLALDAFAATGARGSIEHAQLLTAADAARMARLGVVASVQPAHLLDDRDVAERVWAGRTGDAFPFRTLLDAGVPLAFGSDAPVAPLDPWLAMAAAVHRSADERAPWHPEQQLGVAEALAASTDGQGTLGAGSRGDVVLLDADPLAPAATTAEAAARLRAMPVAATVLGGRVTHDAR